MNTLTKINISNFAMLYFCGTNFVLKEFTYGKTQLSFANLFFRVFTGKLLINEYFWNHFEGNLRRFMCLIFKRNILHL